MGDTKKTNDGVGGSLFTGEHSVFVQNNEHQDDEEDLEDQMRRQEELQNLIANAFDDLEFEDENSRVNSSFESTNSSKYRSNISNIRGSGDNYSFTDKNYKNTSLNSFEQLQVLYQVRVQESQKLAKELDILKEQLKVERDQTSRKMLLLEADNNRINLSLQQSQELLVEKTDVIDKKSKEIEQLKEFVENLQSSNEKFEEEVLLWKSNSNELEQKLHLIEKGINKNIPEKQIRAHYEQEVNKLQEILQVTNYKLEKTEKDCHNLQTQIQEIEHDKEVALAEKAGVINTITKTLEDSQAQCFSLMNKLTSLQQEKNTLENELLSNNTTFKQHTSSQNYEEVIVTLREELKRCLEEQNKKRQEIGQLEDLVKEVRQKERKLQQELNNKQSTEKNENEELRQQNINLTEEVLMLKQKLKEVEEQINKKPQQCNSLDSSRSSISSEKHKKDREEYEKHKQELERLEKQINESINLKDRYIACEQQCLTLQENIADLSSKLSDSQLTITTLKEKLSLKDERDSLIETLKKKAEMFEEYMANKPEPILTQNTSMNTSNYLPETNNCAIQTEEVTDQQMNIYMTQLNELEKVVETQLKHMQILYDENKSLKEKIVFDRNSFNELTSIWSQELKKINKTLQLTIYQNDTLIKDIDLLKKENTQKQLMCDILNSKIEQAKEYINLMEVTSTRHNKHVVIEHEQTKAKIENLLGMIQARVTRCMNVAKSNI